MKKIKYIAFVFLLFSICTFAQKIGVVDTNYILEKLPQYRDAKSRLDQQVKSWQDDIQKKQAAYQKRKETFENEKVLLVGDQLRQRQQELDDMEKDINTTIKNRFGEDGEINKMRSTVAMPFQDMIWSAIKTIADRNSLGIILDKNTNNVLLIDKKFDYTDRVLEFLTKNQGKQTKENKQKR